MIGSDIVIVDRDQAQRKCNNGESDSTINWQED